MVFFSCPVGFVAVVKTISITVGANVADVHAWIEDDEGGKLASMFQSNTLGNPPFTYLAFGDWVLMTGETLSPATNGITADFWVSGYLLTQP